VSARHGRDEKAADLARGLLGRLDRRGGMARARAVAAWSEVAGDEIAKHACGFAMREGELVVFVDAPVWATELSALSEHYRRAVNEHLGEEAVSAIRFTVSRQAGERREEDERQAAVDDSYRVDKVEPVPADETERAQVRQMAAAIKDDEVRAAVTAAALADLEWKKGLRARGSQKGSQGLPAEPE
jgi:hypothetical protein